MEQAVVSGIAFNRDEAKITVMGVPDKPGIAYQILGPVAAANIDIDVIIQNVSHDGKTDFSFTVHRNDYQRTLDLLKNTVLPATGAAQVMGDPKICKVSIVGIGMRSHVGVASTMFRTLSEEGINIQMITTSEIKTSVVIDEKYMELAVRALHKAFGLDAPEHRGLSEGPRRNRCERLECGSSCWSRDRVAEGAPLLREYVGKTCIEGSNPSDSARPRWRRCWAPA
jgi:aspartate kinase